MEIMWLLVGLYTIVETNSLLHGCSFVIPLEIRIIFGFTRIWIA